MSQTTTELHNYKDTATTVVQEIFSTMLGTQVTPFESSEVRELSHPVVGAVYFAGNWKGAVLLECERPLSFALTAQLMSIKQPDSLDDDVRDTMGEIVNMIAGNLKSSLPSGTHLSMPSVVEGSQFTLRVCGGNESIRMDFDSSRGPFSLTLVEMAD